MQKTKIQIEDCGKFARCYVPLFGDLYGKTVEEIKQTLELMSKVGMFCNIV